MTTKFVVFVALNTKVHRQSGKNALVHATCSNLHFPNTSKGKKELDAVPHVAINTSKSEDGDSEPSEPPNNKGKRLAGLCKEVKKYKK